MSPTEPHQIIRQARHKLQLNQCLFAAELGKTQSVLSRYESGKVNPPTNIIIHCTNILNNDGTSDDIEQLITKIRSLNGDQHLKLRQALNTLLNNCIREN